MPRILKTRDYTESELLEIAEQLVEKTQKELRESYTSAERTKKEIEWRYHLQCVRHWKVKILEEKRKQKLAQDGLFNPNSIL